MRLAKIYRRAAYAAGACIVLAFVALACQQSWSDGPLLPSRASVRAVAGPSVVTGNATQSGSATATAGAPEVVGPSVVSVQKDENGSFQYVVDGTPHVIIGMGYNPIYRYLSDDERAANYDRDFQILSEAGVNTITGWDFDQGYEQDKFDEVTLDHASQHGLGVVMPFYLPPEGNYRDEAFVQSLLDQAAEKIARFKDHRALRIWGVGNEVLHQNHSRRMWAAFAPFYLRLADLFHTLDPSHPVIYREAEGYLLPAIMNLVRNDLGERPWLLFGVNLYSLNLESFLDAWPNYGFERPLVVSEFGAEPTWSGGRALGYVNMWRGIRAHSDYVLGGAAYAWTTEGPEPTDSKWGLMDGESKPIDDTFEQLAADWNGVNSGLCECR